MDLSGSRFSVRRILGLLLATGTLWLSAACLPNSTQASNGAAPAEGCEQVTEAAVTKIRETYAICPLASGPAVLGRNDLRAVYDGLAPGGSLNVTENFLRTDERWPYVDVRGPGANTSEDMPDPFRAAYLMHAADPAFDGPLLFIAPAQVQHSLGVVGAGETPPRCLDCHRRALCPNGLWAGSGPEMVNLPILLRIRPNPEQRFSARPSASS